MLLKAAARGRAPWTPPATQMQNKTALLRTASGFEAILPKNKFLCREMYTFPFSLCYHVTRSLGEQGQMPPPSLSPQQGRSASPWRAPAKTHTVKYTKWGFFDEKQNKTLAQSCISRTPKSLTPARVGREGTLETGLTLSVPPRQHGTEPRLTRRPRQTPNCCWEDGSTAKRLQQQSNEMKIESIQQMPIPHPALYKTRDLGSRGNAGSGCSRHAVQEPTEKSCCLKVLSLPVTS